METKETIVPAEMLANMKEHGQELKELYVAYELAELGWQMFDERCNDVIDRVLAEHEFYYDDKGFMESKRAQEPPLKKGERVMSHKHEWLLSSKEFERLHKLARPIMVAEGLTDKQGYFTQDWSKMVCDARLAVFDFVCLKLLPKNIGEQIYALRWNVLKQDKVIEIVKRMYGGKEAA